jgi:hypothetical protein
MDKKPPIKPELVNEFVLKGHGDLQRVKELLEQEPALLNAAWDWGGGDWETALGAAAHVGRREIALYLIERGARVDIFAAAMLGWLDVVRAIAAAQPGALSAPGPHGIPLMVHAQNGGEAAAAVVEFLKEKSAS